MAVGLMPYLLTTIGANAGDPALARVDVHPVSTVHAFRRSS